MPSAVNINWYIALSSILFTIGVLGVLLRRNAIILFMSVELMLNTTCLEGVVGAPFSIAIAPEGGSGSVLGVTAIIAL